MTYLQVLVVRPVLVVLDHHLVLEVQGFLWGPESHLPPGALADPADLGIRHPCPPENNLKSVSQDKEDSLELLFTLYDLKPHLSEF